MEDEGAFEVDSAAEVDSQAVEEASEELLREAEGLQEAEAASQDLPQKATGVNAISTAISSSDGTLESVTYSDEQTYVYEGKETVICYLCGVGLKPQTMVPHLEESTKHADNQNVL